MAFPLMEKMIWIDYAMSVLILISALIGLIRGFVREAFALGSWIAAIWVAMHYSRDLSPLLQNTVEYPPFRMALMSIALFVSTLVLCSIIGTILKHLVIRVGLTASDRILGMLFGLLRGGVLLTLLVLLAGLSQAPQENWWQQSQLLPIFQSFAVFLQTFIPADMAGNIHFR